MPRLRGSSSDASNGGDIGNGCCGAGADKPLENELGHLSEMGTPRQTGRQLNGWRWPIGARSPRHRPAIASPSAGQSRAIARPSPGHRRAIARPSPGHRRAIARPSPRHRPAVAGPWPRQLGSTGRILITQVTPSLSIIGDINTNTNTNNNDSIYSEIVLQKNKQTNKQTNKPKRVDQGSQTADVQTLLLAEAFIVCHCNRVVSKHVGFMYLLAMK